MKSFVVTGGGRGVGAGICAAIAARGDAVVVLDLAPTSSYPSVTGSAADLDAAIAARELAESLAPLGGWVNNAAVFRDADLHDAPGEIRALVDANLAPVIVGSATAASAFLASGNPGSIVNVSSHQAQRAVPGALAYATAKAAIEGLTRATAVDYGRFGIRANAVALGTIATERFDSTLEPALAALHPIGRVGLPRDVAAVVSFLLSDAAGFVTGTVIPVDGGRAALGQDPEARS